MCNAMFCAGNKYIIIISDTQCQALYKEQFGRHVKQFNKSTQLDLGNIDNDIG